MSGTRSLRSGVAIHRAACTSGPSRISSRQMMPYTGSCTKYAMVRTAKNRTKNILNTFVSPSLVCSRTAHTNNETVLLILQRKRVQAIYLHSPLLLGGITTSYPCRQAYHHRQQVLPFQEFPQQPHPSSLPSPQ